MYRIYSDFAHSAKASCMFKICHSLGSDFAANIL